MAARTYDKAREIISRLDLSKYGIKAVKNGHLKAREVERAENEYRHFLLLAWVNQRHQSTEFIVPTEHADALWHEHLMYTSEYRAFCDELFGSYLDHHPGLEKGSAPFNRAVEHTKKTSKRDAADGFAPNYMGGCGATTTPAPSPTASSPTKSSPVTSSDSAPADGAGCGAGCGG